MRKAIIAICFGGLFVWLCSDIKKFADETVKKDAEYYQQLYDDYNKLRIESKDGSHYFYNSYTAHKNNDNQLSIYIRRVGDYKPYLWLKISSNKSTIANADYIYLYADDKTIEIPLGDIYKVERAKGGAYVDLQIGKMLTEHLADMAKAYDASVKFFGYSSGDIQQYYLTKEQQNGITQVLNGYKYLLHINP